MSNDAVAQTNLREPLKQDSGGDRHRESEKEFDTEDSTLERLYARQASNLRDYLRKLVGSGPPDPDDVVQAAFERIATKKNFSDIKNPSAFLWRTAQNIVTSEFRSATVREKHRENIQDVFYATKSDDCDPERVLIARVEVSSIFEVLKTMKPKRRDALLMSRVDGLSVSEIARRLGLARSTVSKRLALAMMELDAAVNRDPDIKADDV